MSRGKRGNLRNGTGPPIGIMSEKSSKIHVWVPDLFSTIGGIQAFSRYLIEALYEEIGSDKIRVLVKNDVSGSEHLENGFRNIDALGHWPLVLRTPRFAIESLRQAYRERPGLIVSTHLNFGPVAQFIRRCLGIRYVLVAHGIDAWYLKDGSRRKALQQADLVLAVSRYTRDRLVQEIGIDANRIKIFPNTFAPDMFSIGFKSPQLLNKHGLSPQTPVILTVCRLAEADRYKGYDQIIKAMPRILSEVPNARYLIVGKGPDRPRIEKLIAEVGVQDAVTLVGFVPDEELADYYNLCDLFAMPSKAEGFGIVYLEALACGKPVLAGNKDGSRDALADGELGVLVDPDDVGEIAREVIRVITHQHSHPCIYQPELLRKRVIELFGFSTFKHTLTRYLSDWVSIKPNQTSSNYMGR